MTIKQQIIGGLISWIVAPFSWSKWVDINTFNYADTGYLLQGRMNSVSNAKQFRVTTMKQLTCTAYYATATLDRLKEVGLSQ